MHNPFPFMSSVTASHYKRNVLFRLLAFLDNTGTQSFVLANEVSEDGHFLHPEVVFGEGTAAAGILSAAVKALRANVRHFFRSAEEQQALLRAIGTGVLEPAPEDAVSTADGTTRAPSAPAFPVTTSTETCETVSDPQLQNQKGNPSCVKGSEDVVDSHASLPIDTTWSHLVCHPASLLHYAEQVESELPIHLFVRLREVLVVAPSDPPPSNGVDAEPAPPGTAAFSETPFVEQMLIDGLDEWMRSRPEAEVKRMIMACGVQPTVLASAFEQQQQQQRQQSFAAAQSPSDASCAHTSAALPDALVDFVVDVMFPVLTAGTSPSSSTIATQSTTASASGEGLLDWLLLSYEKNHEAIEVGEEEGESSGSDAVGEDSSSPRKIPRSEGGSPQASQKDEEKDSLGAWQPEEGEEVLTADNIDRYLKEFPQRIPKEVLREKRKPITDPAISAFELENHYTAAELRKLIKDRVGSMTAQEAAALMGCPLSEAQVTQAARATRKAQFVEWVLAAHRGRAESAQDKP
ncbi:hypothetical protein ABL78_7738 [Leptomonas seymouri]|uniref:Uncharacterized protein n=1 Tax=Leptomonas seymouri TaxID=5684 RepID=A0A0N1PB34_LEPSE|nr:hypothetical protein ABL78_7738 [Leptomonas seymouri]|eukprot:KPI83235.1 hypothetical protein ABL78_7738 [Leptomonas seymouri]